MLVEFSECVEFFPVDFFGDVILEVMDFLRSECCTDLTQRASENYFFFFVDVTTFFTCHLFTWEKSYKMFCV